MLSPHRSRLRVAGRSGPRPRPAGRLKGDAVLSDPAYTNELRLGCNFAVWHPHMEAEIADNEQIPEEDRAYGGLPGAEIVGLRNSRIQLAVAEVRYSTIGDVEPAQAMRVRDVIRSTGLSFLHVEPTQRHEVTFSVDPSGSAVPQAAATGGWVLTDESRSLTVNLFPDLAFVQTNVYSRYRESLRPALAGVLEALAAVFEPDLVQRVGLRYVNRFEDRAVRTASDWQGKIAPSFLGVLSDDVLGPLAQTTQQQVELALEPGVGALVRYGAFVDHAAAGSSAYLVDLDVFRQVTDTFEPELILAGARRLNRTALSLFQRIVEPSYRQTMDPVPLELSGDEQDLGR
jgi:uncharacterized protein (TIGR04255 family)